jgi:hypothetical protein
MIRKIARSLPIFGLLVIMALSATAFADTINLSLQSSTESGLPGAILSYMATVSAPITNTAPVYLNSDSTTVDYPLTLDDSGFLFSFPLFLDPGGSYTGVLFTVSIPTYAAPQTYNGYFEIDGGADGSASNYLASVSFQANVVPEPGYFLLMLTAVSGLALMVFRKQQRCQERDAAPSCVPDRPKVAPSHVAELQATPKSSIFGAPGGTRTPGSKFVY